MLTGHGGIVLVSVIQGGDMCQISASIQTEAGTSHPHVSALPLQVFDRRILHPGTSLVRDPYVDLSFGTRAGYDAA